MHMCSFQACLGEAVTLSEVKKAIIEWTEAYEGKYTTFSPHDCWQCKEKC